MQTKKLQTPGNKPEFVDYNLHNYLEGLPYSTKSDDVIYDFLRKSNRPIIYKDTARVLELIVLLHNPQRILEIGTHSGYSTLCLSRFLNSMAMIDTIEFRVDHIAEAMNNVEMYGNIDKVVFHQGRALEVLESLFWNDSFDLIFIDADKKSYPKYLDYAVQHLNSKGLILVDNLLWKGAVFSNDESLIEKPSTKTIEQFNKDFIALKGFHSQILSVGDGLGIASKVD